MILEDHKLIFIHIIKTAGSSIERLYESSESDHRTAQSYLSKLGKEEYDSYFKFTIVRNPWDKMVSQYFFNGHKWTPEGTSFKEYIRMFGNGTQVSTFSPFHLPYISDINGNIIVDYIGYFEKLQESFDIVCHEVGLPIVKLPHHKKSKHQDYRELYDDESKDIVFRRFKKEIEMFGYQFNGLR